MAQSVDEIITRIVNDCLKDGIAPWRKPWQVNGVSLYVSRQGRPYSFLNSLLLMSQGKPAGEFITFNQIKAEGGKVKKGAKSAIVTFYKPNIKAITISAEDSEDGEEHTIYKKSFILRYYNVFHINDVEGLQPKHVQTEVKADNNIKPIDAAEKMLKAYLDSEGAPAFSDGHNEAFYRPSTDEICVPALTQFANPAEYYSTAFHESVHSTGHKSRLDRLNDKEVFGSVTYSREELVAEIGAATLVAMCGIDDADSYRNSVAYLQGWAKHLADHPKDFATAARRAEKAVNWVMGIKQTQAEETNEVTDAA